MIKITNTESGESTEAAYEMVPEGTLDMIEAKDKRIAELEEGMSRIYRIISKQLTFPAYADKTAFSNMAEICELFLDKSEGGADE